MQTPTILKKRPTADVAQRASELKHVSLELISPAWNICTEEIMQVLSDERDFLVVGVLGTQGSGKSTLVNHLCDLCPCMRNCEGTASAAELLWGPLPTHASHPFSSITHVTRSIEMRVRPGDRVIALDSPPLLSPSLLADMAAGLQAVPGILPVLLSSTQGARVRDSRGVSAEAGQFVMALQSLIFFLCACHVVVVMVDSLDQPDLWELLLLADMIAADLPDASTAGNATSTAGTSLPKGRTADCCLVLNASRPMMQQPYTLHPQLELCSQLLAGTAFSRSVHLKYPMPSRQESRALHHSSSSGYKASAGVLSTAVGRGANHSDALNTPGPPSAATQADATAPDSTLEPKEHAAPLFLPQSTATNPPLDMAHITHMSHGGSDRAFATMRRRGGSSATNALFVCAQPHEHFPINFYHLPRSFAPDKHSFADDRRPNYVNGSTEGRIHSSSTEGRGAPDYDAPSGVDARKAQAAPDVRGTASGGRGTHSASSRSKNTAGAKPEHYAGAFAEEVSASEPHMGPAAPHGQHMANLSRMTDHSAHGQHIRPHGSPHVPHVGLEGHAIERLKNMLLRFPRQPFSWGMTEREWLKGCEAIWQHMQQSQHVVDVCTRLSQTSYGGAGGLGWATRH